MQYVPDPFGPLLLVKQVLENRIILLEGRHLEKILTKKRK